MLCDIQTTTVTAPARLLTKMLHFYIPGSTMPLVAMHVAQRLQNTLQCSPSPGAAARAARAKTRSKALHSWITAEDCRCKEARCRAKFKMRCLYVNFPFLTLALVLVAHLLPLAFALTCSIDPKDVPSTTSCLSAAAASMYVAALLWRAPMLVAPLTSFCFSCLTMPSPRKISPTSWLTRATKRARHTGCRSASNATRAMHIVP